MAHTIHNHPNLEAKIKLEKNKVIVDLDFFGPFSKFTYYDRSHIIVDKTEYQQILQKQTEGLKRLTEMTKEDFAVIFGSFTESYINNAVNKLTSLFALHSLIARIGNFDSYQKLIDKGYDVTFIRDRKINPEN